VAIEEIAIRLNEILCLMQNKFFKDECQVTPNFSPHSAVTAANRPAIFVQYHFFGSG
jgi:hypothetical protein